MEIWKEMVNDPRYEISDQGRIRRIAASRGARIGHVIRPQKAGTKGQYSKVILGRNPATRALVHRLVLEAFYGSAPTTHHEANHRNGDTHDNRADNLEWVTRSENMFHAYKVCGRKAHPSRGSKQWNHKLTEADVVEMRKLYDAKLATQDELGRRFGVLQTTISRIVRRKSWSHI